LIFFKQLHASESVAGFQKLFYQSITRPKEERKSQKKKKGCRIDILLLRHLLDMVSG
jgi:hypothetical protein